MSQAFGRINVDSVEGWMNLLSARARDAFGDTTRGQRASRYGMTEASLSALEGGSRVPTEDELDQIVEAHATLGVSLGRATLAGLPAAQP